MADIILLKKRAAIIKAVRSYFEERGYLEVQTPTLLSSIAPEPYIEPIKSGGKFLQTSPELCMKRLLSAGTKNIFQVCQCFRKGERGRLHLPEFTMLEWYRVGADYISLMDECEDMIRTVACIVGSEMVTDSGESRWERMTVSRAFEKYGQIPVDEALHSDTFEQVLVEDIEPHLEGKEAVFLYDYPGSMASLAKLGSENSHIAERFELYIKGVEIANGFSELTDSKEQRQRFAKDRAAIVEAGRDPGPSPEKFLCDLESMPDSAGIALGVDRLVMVLTECDSIDDVVSFTPEDL